MLLSGLIDDLRNTSSPTEKIAILKTYESGFLHTLLQYAYDPFIKFNVKIREEDIPIPGDGGDQIEKHQKHVMQVLRKCQESFRHQDNKEAITALLSRLDLGSQDLLIGVVNKGLKSGVGLTLVNKAFPGLVSVYPIQLARKYDHDKDYGQVLWDWSYKIDGVRCFAFRRRGIWKLRSRKKDVLGGEIVTMDHLKPYLEKIVYRKYGFTFCDGEIYKHGLRFEDIQSIVSSKKSKKPADFLEYHIFVAGDASNFLLSIGTAVSYLEAMPIDKLVPTYRGSVWSTDKNNIAQLLENACDFGYEGIMLRDRANRYDYKRSPHLLKVKPDREEEPLDCVVLGMEEGPMPIIQDGMQGEETTLVRLYVEQPDGIICKVGSGFSLDFRRHYQANPNEIIGKTIEVKHQGFGANGKMRFPSLHRIREDL